MRSGKLNRVCEIQYKYVNTNTDYGTEEITWLPLATVWCEKMDVLPSRSEKVLSGLEVSADQSRIRMIFRTDIDNTMRMLIEDKLYQIVSGPAEIGHKDLIEFVVEKYSV